MLKADTLLCHQRADAGSGLRYSRTRFGAAGCHGLVLVVWLFRTTVV